MTTYNLPTDPFIPAGEPSCTCACHRDPSVKHIMPCCTPKPLDPVETLRALFYAIHSYKYAEEEAKDEEWNIVESAMEKAGTCLNNPTVRREAPPTLNDELIKDIEFSIAVVSKLYPDRAEAMSNRLSKYRKAEHAVTVIHDEILVSREAVRRIFLENGFTIKEGQTDLKPYVYEAAYALLTEVMWVKP